MERLEEVPWLARSRLLYWGDIDTHGFSILSRLRAVSPVASLMMDRETLLAHRRMWVQEPEQRGDEPEHLEPAERALFQELLSGVHGDRVRLEQERVGFGWVRKALFGLG